MGKSKRHRYEDPSVVASLRYVSTMTPSSPNLEMVEIKHDNPPFHYVAQPVPEKAQKENPKDICGRRKPRLDLLPPTALVPLASVLAHGADKYGPYNWRQTPISAVVYIAATLRHVFAWADGEDKDAESGESHLTHAMATLAIMLDAIETQSIKDDRAKSGVVARMLRERSGEPYPNDD